MWSLQSVSLGGCQYGFHLRLSVWVSLGDSCGGCFFVVVVVVVFFLETFVVVFGSGFGGFF